MKNCQSCGMPLENDVVYGTEKDGSRTEMFCIYCYQDGAFTQPELTLSEMTDICTGFLVKEGVAEGEARSMMEQVLPQLDRWRG